MSTDSFDFSDIPDESALEGNTPVKEGTYHFVVEKVDPEHVSSKKGTPGIEFVLQVLAGTDDQKGKKLFETFYLPSSEQADGGEFLTKRIAKIAVTLDLIPPTDLGRAGVKIPWEKALARQFIAVVKHEEGEKGRVNAGIDGLKMYRVTDPEVVEIPKSPEGLAMMGLPPEGGSAEQPAAQPEAAPAKATSIADL